VTLTAANIWTTSSSRLFVTDRISKQRYLVDTGSDLCIFPCKLLPGRRDRTDYTLYAANGTIIPAYGWTSRSLNLGLRRDFTWRFVIPDIQLPIIGLDLLSHYGLLVDCRNNRLLDGVTWLTAPGLMALPSVCNVKVIAGCTPPDSLREEFPELTKPTGSHCEARHSMTHHIWTTPGPPVACHPPANLILTIWLSPRPSSMPCCRTAQPDALRAHSRPPSISCPRRTAVGGPVETTLNACTIPDRYPVPHIQDYSHHLSGCTTFPKIDLVRAFHQIPVHPDDVQKSAIITPFGLFEFPFMSFGLRNATQTFQHFMDEILKDLGFCFAYIDNILVFSRSPKNTTNTSAPSLPNSSLTASCWTLPSAFSVSPKFLSFVTESHPWVLSHSPNVLLICKPVPLPRPSANSNVSWECLISIGVSFHTQPLSKPLSMTSFLAQSQGLTSCYLDRGTRCILQRT
jgi:cleavage and polyadenylation specificity factor subunit 1